MHAFLQYDLYHRLVVFRPLRRQYVEDASVIDMTPVSTQIPSTTQKFNDVYLNSAKLCSIIQLFNYLKKGAIIPYFPKYPRGSPFSRELRHPEKLSPVEVKRLLFIKT